MPITRANRLNVWLAIGTASLLVLVALSQTMSSRYELNLNGRMARLGVGAFSFSSLRNPTSSRVYIPFSEFSETRWIQGVAGFNYFENLYLSNGTYIVLTTDPDHLPDYGVAGILSDPSDPEDKWHHHPPAGEDRFIVFTPEEARDRGIVRGSAVRKPGISIFFNDVREGTQSSFLDHYYHFIGEMFLGAWRVISAAGDTDLPARIIYRADSENWRDRARITTWFQQAVLANTLVEEADVFNDRVRSQMTFVFDKMVLADRWSAHRVGQEVRWWNKANADLPLLPVERTWMDPLRNQLKRLVTSEGCEVARKDAKVPVVVYINRQTTGRRLVDDHAAALVVEMNKLHQEGIIEFHDAQMEKLHRVDQFCLALRADIMFGVHGNGLSHQLWMKPGGAVMEIMAAPGFARDYAILSEMMNHEYYAIHENTTFPPEQWRRPDGWAVGQGPDFHSARIRVDGKYMADMVREMAAKRVDVVEPTLAY